MFSTKSKEYLLLSPYFQGLELLLRSAILIAYKKYLCQQNSKDVKKLENEISKAKDQKKFLETLTDTFNYENMLIDWYSYYSPDKNTDENIQMILKRYILAENVLFNRLYKKYVDKNWDEYQDLWFAVCQRPIKSKKYKLDKDGYVAIKFVK